MIPGPMPRTSPGSGGGMTRKCWTKSLGERGHRIRLYEKYSGGPIMRSVYIDGKEVRKSLAHRDKEKATRQGYELLNALLTNENALTQRDEGRMLRQVVEFFGMARRVETLSESDVKRYTMARRQGDVAPPGAEHGRPIRDRTIEAELEMLLRALRWAVRERKTNGERLLKENPLVGVRLPSEKNPNRPVMAHDVYCRLLAVAERVHPLLKTGLDRGGGYGSPAVGLAESVLGRRRF